MPARLVVLSLVLAVSAACDGTIPRPGAMGPPADAAAPLPFVPRDGSRLKARWLEGPGGHRIFDGFHDAELQVDCSFSTRMDGAPLCLPRGNYLASDPDWADASCTQPVVWIEQPACQLSPFVFQVDISDPCRYRERRFRLGPAVAGGRVYRRDRTRGCVPRPEFSGVTPHHLGEELLSGAFVRGNLVAEPAPPGQPLQRLVLEAEDGAAVDQGFRSPGGGYDCWPELRPDGSAFCAPDAASVSLFAFTDSECREPAVTTVPACGPPPARVRRYATVELAPGTCSWATTIHELGPPAQPGYGVTFFETCEPALSTSRVTYHGVGPAFSPDRFVTFAQITEPTSGLGRRHLVAPGGAAVTYGWFDHTRKAPCSRAAVAGSERCIPPSGHLGDVFADESCTRPVLRATDGECLPRFARWPRHSTCPPTEEIYAVGPRHRGLVYEPAFPDAQASVKCRFAFAIAPTDVFHEVTPVAGDQFPELKPIEPRR